MGLIAAAAGDIGADRGDAVGEASPFEEFEGAIDGRRLGGLGGAQPLQLGGQRAVARATAAFTAAGPGPLTA